MRKVFSLFLICCFILSLFGISVTASSEKLTLEEAKDIIWKAYLFTNQVRNSPELNFENVYVSDVGQPGELKYYEVFEFPGGSYDSMKEYAKTIYSDDIEKYSYTYSRYLPQATPLFVIAEDGTIYGGCDRIIQYTSVFLSLDGKVPGYVFPFVTKSTDDYNADKLLVEMVESTKSAATVKVCFRLGTEMEERIHWADCNFVKEDGVWKISGGEYFNLFNGTYRETSPSTSDPAFDRIVLMTTVPIVCLVPAFYLLRRRRRNVIQ